MANFLLIKKLMKERGNMEKQLMCVIVDKRDGDVYWTDEVGGFHSPPIGWGPDGINCGECCEITCKGCVIYERGRK